MQLEERKELSEFARELREYFLEIKNTNPRFSLRSFAKTLGVSQSLITLVFQGKRNFSAEQESRVRGIISSRSGTPFAHAEVRHLDAENFRLISQWHHFAILSLNGTHDYQADAGWIANRLHISQTQAQSALDRLIDLGFLNPDGSRKKTKKPAEARFNAPAPSLATRTYHRSTIEMALKQLDLTDHASFEARSIRGNSLSIPLKDIQRAKKAIERFEKKFFETFTQKTGDEVYQLNFQFFPITKLKQKDPNHE